MATHVVHNGSEKLGFATNPKLETDSVGQLKIKYKISAKMLHDCLQPLLETEQSTDQVGFRRGPGKGHA